MAQNKIDYTELLNSFYLALENNRSIEDLEILAEELKEFGATDKELQKAQAEASSLYHKNCF